MGFRRGDPVPYQCRDLQLADFMVLREVVCEENGSGDCESEHLFHPCWGDFGREAQHAGRGIRQEDRHHREDEAELFVGYCCEGKQVAEEETLEVRPRRSKQPVEEERKVVEQQDWNRLEEIEVDAGHAVEGRQRVCDVELEEAPERHVES